MVKAKKVFVTIAACVTATAVGAVLLGAVDTGGNKKKDEAPQVIDDRVLVAAAAPVRGSIAVTGEFIGTAEPNREITVYPKAAGEVLSVNYDVGDVIEAGAVLCEIDSTTLKYSISQMQAAVSSAQAKANYNLAVAQNDLDTLDFNVEKGFDSTILNAESAVESAEKQLETAKIGLASANANLVSARTNLRHLRDNEDDYVYGNNINGGILGEYSYENSENQLRSTVRQYEIAVSNAEKAVETAELGLEQAKERLKTAKIVSKEQRVTTSTRVHSAELNTDMKDQYIAIEKLQDDLKNYTVTSAISGVVEQRNIDPYDMASQQTPLFVIANKDAMTISFNVSESSLAHMKLGDKVDVEKNGTHFKGTITEIASSVDAKSGLFTIEATVENPPEALFSGSSVKVFADVQKAENDLLLPIDAIYYDSGNPYVYIADNGVAKKTFVETGISNEENIQILSGLTSGDSVIVTWNSGLADGARIKFSVDEEDTSAPESSESGEE